MYPEVELVIQYPEVELVVKYPEVELVVQYPEVELVIQYPEVELVVQNGVPRPCNVAFLSIATTRRLKLQTPIQSGQSFFDPSKNLRPIEESSTSIIDLNLRHFFDRSYQGR